MPADDGLLGIALAAVGEFLAFARPHLLDHFLDDAFGDHGLHRGRGGGARQFRGVVVQIILERESRRGQRLRQFGAVAIKRIGLQSQLPGQHIGLAAFPDRCGAGHVDGLGDRARDERLYRRHHADMRVHAQRALADAPAGIGAIEYRQMLRLQIGRAFQGHGAADIEIGGIHIGLGETQRLQHVEISCVHLGRIELQHVAAELFAQGPFVEDEADVEGRFQRRLDLPDLLLAEALGPQGVQVEPAGEALQRAIAHRIGHDGVGFDVGIAQAGQRFGDATVDDLEIAAARQGLEFHQREIRLHAGGVAIHHQADGAGGRDHGGLGIAETELLAHRQGVVPGAAGGEREILLLDRGKVQRHRRGRKPLVSGIFAMGGAGMIAHHPQHRLLIGGIFREGPQFAGQFRAGGIGDTRHDRRNGAGDGAAFAAVISDARRHQKPADIGEAQAEGAIVVGKLRDFPGRKLRHHHRNLQHDGPEPDRVLECRHVENLGGAFAFAELHQVQRRQIAGGIVQEHVFAAGV